MSAEKFVLGKPVEMRIVEAADIEGIEQTAHDYTSRIVKCIGNKIFVEFPVKVGRCMLQKGDLLHILGPYDHEYGSVYTSIADIIQGDVPILVLDLVSEVKRLQRRGLFRLSILKEIRFKANTAAEYEAYLTDISGGGAAISTELEINEGSTISLQMDLDGKELEVQGDIVRKKYNKDKNVFTYGLYFSTIDKKHQDIIIQYIYKEQAKALKRGIRE